MFSGCPSVCVRTYDPGAGIPGGLAVRRLVVFNLHCIGIRLEYSNVHCRVVDPRRKYAVRSFLFTAVSHAVWSLAVLHDIAASYTLFSHCCTRTMCYLLVTCSLLVS